MRTTTPTRIVIACVSGTLLGCIPLVLNADDRQFDVPEVTPGEILPPANPAAQQQFNRALRGENVPSNTPILRDSLDAARSIGSVLDGSSLDPDSGQLRGQDLIPRQETPVQASTAPRQIQQPDQGRPRNIGRVSNEVPTFDRAHDRNPMPAPQLRGPAMNPPVGSPRPASSGQEDQFYAAEMLLRTARMLNKLSPSNPARQQLVASMRAEAVRLLSKPSGRSPYGGAPMQPTQSY